MQPFAFKKCQIPFATLLFGFIIVLVTGMLQIFSMWKWAMQDY